MPWGRRELRVLESLKEWYNYNTKSDRGGGGDGAGEVGRVLVTQGLLACVREFGLNERQNSSN